MASERLKKQGVKKMSKLKVTLKGIKLNFADDEGGLNRLPFSGTCLFTDTISNGTPEGAIKPVLFPTEEVQKAVDTMVNMGVNCVFPDPDSWAFYDPSDIFSGHDPRNKIGTVTSASLVGNEMQISGVLWDYDFPDIADLYMSAKNSLGFSVEVFFTPVEKKGYTEAHNIQFAGSAILFSDLAAFKETYIAAAKKKGANNMPMTKDELQKIIVEAMGQSTAKITELSKKIDDMATKQEKIEVAFAKQEKEKEEKAKADKEKAALAAKKAADEEEAKKKAALKAAQLAKKKEEEDKKLEPQRKSTAFSNIVPRYSEDVQKRRKGILSDKGLTSSQQFQKLLELREEK